MQNPYEFDFNIMNKYLIDEKLLIDDKRSKKQEKMRTRSNTDAYFSFNKRRYMEISNKKT